MINIDIVSITNCWCFNLISKWNLWLLTRLVKNDWLIYFPSIVLNPAQSLSLSWPTILRQWHIHQQRTWLRFRYCFVSFCVVWPCNHFKNGGSSSFQKHPGCSHSKASTQICGEIELRFPDSMTLMRQTCSARHIRPIALVESTRWKSSMHF